MTTHDSTPVHDQVDEQAVEAFALHLTDILTGGLLTPLLDIGRRTGLVESLAEGPGTSAEIAARSGLQERYVREWLGAMACAGVVEYAAARGHYWLPAEHAAVLTGDTADNMLSVAALVMALTPQTDAVARCFVEGGGVPYPAFLPAVQEAMDLLWQPLCRDVLVSETLPLAPGLTELLDQGTRVADVACGSGNAVHTLAAAFPRSEFVGFDLDPAGIDLARSRAASLGLANVSFEVADAAEWTPDEPFGAAFVFNAVHDQARPLDVLHAIHDALVPGGILLLNEPRVSSNLEDNLDVPGTALIYAISTLHCLTVSLAEGGAGLGTAWGEQVAVRMLRDAGFGEVAVHDAPGDPTNAVFVTRRPA